MIRHKVLAFALVTTLLSPVVYAAPVNLHTPLNAMFGKGKPTTPRGKTVQLNLSNASASDMSILAGDTAMTIPAGKSVSVDLPVGTRIVANDTTATHHTGSLLVEVASQFKGTTISLR